MSYPRPAKKVERKFRFPGEGEKRQCPMCLTPGPRTRYCEKKCWDDKAFGALPMIEHLHWWCECNFEWMTPTAELKDFSEKLAKGLQ